jgi:hypothetical protein
MLRKQPSAPASVLARGLGNEFQQLTSQNASMVAAVYLSAIEHHYKYDI